MADDPGDAGDLTDELNDALRDLIDVVRTADLTGVELHGAVEAVRGLTDGFRPHVVPGVRMQASLRIDDEGPTRPDGESLLGSADRRPGDYFPYSPIVGRRNPIAPPVPMWPVRVDSGVEIHGEMTLRAPYNGPPASVHGGIIAAVFDELLGVTAIANDGAGFTGTLTIVYRSTTPIEEPVTLRGWLDRREGRKTYAKGEIHHGATLCAEAEGIFIGFAREAFEQRRSDLG